MRAKVQKNSELCKIYLHISKKCSTFALDLGVLPLVRGISSSHPPLRVRYTPHFLRKALRRHNIIINKHYYYSHSKKKSGKLILVELGQCISWKPEEGVPRYKQSNVRTLGVSVSRL